jgi:hypothetical protein
MWLSLGRFIKLPILLMFLLLQLFLATSTCPIEIGLDRSYILLIHRLSCCIMIFLLMNDGLRSFRLFYFNLDRAKYAVKACPILSRYIS